MNYEQFAIWLHGFLEISNAETINEQQTQIIRDHLTLLFEKKTPDRSKKGEKTDLQILEEKFKQIEEQNKDKFPPYPPYAPMPMPCPTLPNWDKWVLPDKIICSDGTGSPLPELGTTVCSVADTKTYC